jgi:hypothetical protein
MASRSAVKREGLEGLRRNDSSVSKTRRGGTARSFAPRPERESAEPRKARSGACTGRAQSTKIKITTVKGFCKIEGLKLSIKFWPENVDNGDVSLIWETNCHQGG